MLTHNGKDMFPIGSFKKNYLFIEAFLCDNKIRYNGNLNYEFDPANTSLSSYSNSCTKDILLRVLKKVKLNTNDYTLVEKWITKIERNNKIELIIN